MPGATRDQIGQQQRDLLFSHANEGHIQRKGDMLVAAAALQAVATQIPLLLTNTSFFLSLMYECLQSHSCPRSGHTCSGQDAGCTAAAAAVLPLQPRPSAQATSINGGERPS